jgi:Spy/CpxP family protein refolding chaperone
MITKLLASAAIVLGAAIGVAAPALADPTPTPNPHPYAGVNPFSALNCAPSPNCQQGMPSQALDPQQLTQAIQQGISDAIRGQQ